MIHLLDKPRLTLVSMTVVCICFFWAVDSDAGTLQISSDPFTNPGSQHMTEVEPHIFANGSTIVATFQQGRFYSGGCSDIGFTTSVDSGATWRAGSLPGITEFAGGVYQGVSDPAVAYNAAYGLWLIESLPLGGNPAIMVSRSSNGVSWDNPITVWTGDSSSFFDKPWIACDNTPTSPFFGNCYIEWDDVFLGGVVLMATSTDGGSSWADPVAAPDTAGLGGQPLVQPSGRVVVPYRGFDGSIRSFVSDDGGLSWSGSATVAILSDHQVAGELRAISLPSAAIDGDGKIYVAWADCRFRPSCGANDIVISTSSDGLSWSDPTAVPIDPSASTAEYFIPGLGADRNTFAPNVGLALVYYYYPQGNCTPATCQLTGGFITSQDGGNTWSTPIDVTRRMSNDWLADTNQGRMVGDYVATYYTADGVPHPVFAGAVTPTEQFLESMFTTCADCPAAPLAGTENSQAAPQLPAASAPAAATSTDGVGFRIVVPTYRVNIGTVIQLEATGSANQNLAVQWSVEEGASGGLVSNSGIYKAPLSPGVYHVVADNGVERAKVEIQVFTVR
jgi:hypothetical protein